MTTLDYSFAALALYAVVGWMVTTILLTIHGKRRGADVLPLSYCDEVAAAVMLSLLWPLFAWFVLREAKGNRGSRVWLISK